MNGEEKPQSLPATSDAWELAATPGGVAEFVDIMASALRHSVLLRARDAVVKEYDAIRAARAEKGLPPLQWSKNDPLPEAGTLDHSLIRTAEVMKGLNREILKRQAEKNLAAVRRADLPPAHIEAIEAGLSDSAANHVMDGEVVLAELRQLVGRNQ